MSLHCTMEWSHGYWVFFCFLFFSYLLRYNLYKKKKTPAHSNVYDFMSLGICTHPGNHLHDQGNKHIHHLQKKKKSILMTPMTPRLYRPEKLYHVHLQFSPLLKRILIHRPELSHLVFSHNTLYLLFYLKFPLFIATASLMSVSHRL